MHTLTKTGLFLMLIAFMMPAVAQQQKKGMAPPQALPNPFFTYHFGLMDRPAEERVDVLQGLGFEGITYQVNVEKGLQWTDEYLAVPAIAEEDFQIYAVYWVINNDPGEGFDSKFLHALCEKLAGKGTAIWVILRGKPREDTQMVKVLGAMADVAAKYGLEVVIYPHDGDLHALETALHALQIIRMANRPNLKLSFHLCHEMRAGNGPRIAEAIREVAPYIALATISGSDQIVQDNSRDWSDAIKPLDQGEYDTQSFLKALVEAGYRGPVGLHTFGIKESPEIHLARSMGVWNQMAKEVAAGIAGQPFDAPENAYWHAASRSWFVSSLGGGLSLEKDGIGWITRLDEKGQVVDPRWVGGLNAPTGMAAHAGRLYVGDRGEVVVIDIESGKIVEKIPLVGSGFVNDVAASPNGDIYISGTFTQRIYRLKGGILPEIFLESDELDYPNGLWIEGDQLIVATWGPMTNRATFATRHPGTILKVDLETRAIEPLGDGSPIANFDGIVKYGDHYFGTDWTGGRLLMISEKGEVTEVLRGFNQFSDLGCNVAEGILGMPEMGSNRMFFFSLADLLTENQGSRTTVSIKEDAFYINNQLTYPGRYWKGKKIEGLLFNSRMVQGIFDDLNPKTAGQWKYPDTNTWDPNRNTEEFVAEMEEWYAHGLLSFTINMQGGSPMGYGNADWHNSAYYPDGRLRADYMARLKKIFDKADELGMVPILGLFYFGQDQNLEDDAAVIQATENVIDWLFEQGYRNVIIEVANECDNSKYDRDIIKADRIHELIDLIQSKTKHGYRFLVSTSYNGNRIPRENVVSRADFILIHGNGVKEPARISEMVRLTREVKGFRTMPIVFNEDDHFDFDADSNNFFAAIDVYASWGYFDYRMDGEGFEEGYQSVPVDWKMRSERKMQFFKKLKEITGM